MKILSDNIIRFSFIFLFLNVTCYAQNKLQNAESLKQTIVAETKQILNPQRESNLFVQWNQLIKLIGNAEVNRFCNKMMIKFPQDPISPLFCGYINLKLGKIQEATGSFEKGKVLYILKKQQNNILWYNLYLSQCYYNLKNYEKAIEIAKETISITKIILRDSLVEEYTEAEGWLSISLKNTRKKDGRMLERYGDLLYKLNKTEEAIEYWKEAKSVGDGSEFLTQKINEKRFVDQDALNVEMENQSAAKHQNQASENGANIVKGTAQVTLDSANSKITSAPSSMNDLSGFIEVIIGKTYSPAEVDTLPGYPGGNTALKKYLEDNCQFPESALKDGIGGTVYTRCIISTTGNVEEPTIIRGVREDINNEALRVIKSMPKWMPGIKKRKKVNVYYIIPINFLTK